MTPEEAADSIGRTVAYHAYPGAPAEQGVITSVTDSYVFVRYEGDAHSKATRPEMLTLLPRASASDLLGIAPDWCGEQSVDEYVRSQREREEG